MSTTPRHQPITPTGHQRLQHELERLLEELRLLGNELRDGESVSGREQLLLDQQALQQRIDELDEVLATTEIVEPPSDGTAGVGLRVSISMGEGGVVMHYNLVGPFEADGHARRLSIDSPIGSALVGRRAGDVVTVETPGGARDVHVLAVDPA